MVVVAVFTSRLRVLRRLLPALATGLVVGAAVVAASPPSATALADHLEHGLISVALRRLVECLARRADEAGAGLWARRIFCIYRHVDDPTQTGLAHNLPLEQAVEAGVVAGAAAAVLLLVMFTRSVRCLMTRDPVLLAWGADRGRHRADGAVRLHLVIPAAGTAGTDRRLPLPASTAAVDSVVG